MSLVFRLVYEGVEEQLEALSHGEGWVGTVLQASWPGRLPPDLKGGPVLVGVVARQRGTDDLIDVGVDAGLQHPKRTPCSAASSP